MFKLECKGWSWDKDLQIIHADVRLEIDGEVLIDEPLCVDVGLPALVNSISKEAEPNRWAPANEWFRMPFFCCGCGDPECRAFSFRTRHFGGGVVEITELEEKQNEEPRVLGVYRIGIDEYKSQIIPVAEQYLSFVQELNYKPYFADTVGVIEQLLKEQK
jgi:hypothetical protein